MAGHGEVEAYRILLLIVSHLVDDPDTVEIEIILGELGTMFHVRADQRNTAFLLGKQGRTARSIRTIMGAIGRPVGTTTLSLKATRRILIAPWSSRFPHLHTKAPTTHFSVAVPATLDYAAAVPLHLIHYNFARIHNFFALHSGDGGLSVRPRLEL